MCVYICEHMRERETLNFQYSRIPQNIVDKALFHESSEAFSQLASIPQLQGLVSLITNLKRERNQVLFVIVRVCRARLPHLLAPKWLGVSHSVEAAGSVLSDLGSWVCPCPLLAGYTL